MCATEHAAATAPAEPGIKLLYIDSSLLILDKPSGLLAVPGRGEGKQDCLSSRVQAAYPEARVVHRLDMATSGLMMMARSADIQRELNHAFAEHRVRKRYVAVVSGAMQAPADRAAQEWHLIDLPISVDWPRRPLRVIDPECGKPSQTRWQIDSRGMQGALTAASGSVASNPGNATTTRVLLEPITGRSHQLRVHLQAIGHSILGDALYASKPVAAASDRLLLHACMLGFEHPESGEWFMLESVPPF